MINKFLKYGGFGYFGLVFLLIVIDWVMNINSGSTMASFLQLGNNILHIIIAFGIGVAFYMENKTLALVLLIINTMISILVSISNILLVLRIAPEVLDWRNWVTFLLPQFLSILCLIGYFLIKHKSGMLIVMIVQGLFGLYALFALSFIPFVRNSSTEILIFSVFTRIIGLYLSVLIILFVIEYFYHPSLKPIPKSDSQDISFE